VTGSPSNTMPPGPRPMHLTKWHLDPSSRLATIHQRLRQDRQGRQIGPIAFTNGRSKTVSYFDNKSSAVAEMRDPLANYKRWCNLPISGHKEHGQWLRSHWVHEVNGPLPHFLWYEVHRGAYDLPLLSNSVARDAAILRTSTNTLPMQCSYTVQGYQPSVNLRSVGTCGR